jgi:hypothetical protein
MDGEVTILNEWTKYFVKANGERNKKKEYLIHLSIQVF